MSHLTRKVIKSDIEYNMCCIWGHYSPVPSVNFTKLCGVRCVWGQICQSVKHQNVKWDNVNMKWKEFVYKTQLYLIKRCKCNCSNSQTYKYWSIISENKDQSFQSYKAESTSYCLSVYGTYWTRFYIHIFIVWIIFWFVLHIGKKTCQEFFFYVR